MSMFDVLMNMALNDSRINQDKRAISALNMYKSGDYAGLQNMAENLCREYNTTPDQVKQSLIKMGPFNK